MKGALKKATTALATADIIAHAAFLTTFGWRALTGLGLGRFTSVVFAILALVGLGLAFVGNMLVKHGGRTPAGRLGAWLVAGSTAVAAVLLVVA